LLSAPKRSGRSVCVAIFVLSSSFAAACGGGGDGSSSAATAGGGGTLSKQEFVGRVDGYCAQLRHQLLGRELKAYRQEQQREAQQGKQPRPAASFFRTEVAGGIRHLIERIRSLPPPAGDEEQVNAILDAAEGTVRQIEANASNVVRVNPPFVVELESRTINRAKVLSLDYGLKRCGGPAKGS
jgi:hypothetical protein